MLKRIAVVGGDAAFLETLKEAARPDLEFVADKGRGPLPCNTVAVAGGEGDAQTVAKRSASAAAHYEALLLLLAEALDAREGFTSGASERVMDHATRFAAAIDLDADETLTLQRAALLRDIGKMRISNDVLLKKNLLTYDEWALIHSHAHIGADIAATLPGLHDIEPVLRFHHECFDGTGYPDKLEGEEIPKLARMMKILDVFCAMTSPRHYRQTVATHEQAIDHLRMERGKHFDPELVDVFIEKEIGQTD